MASQNVPDVATMKASGYQLPASPLMIFTGLLALLLSSFGVYSICKEGLQFYEVIPVALIVAGTQMATGHRTMDTHLYFEGELIDAATNKPVIKVELWIYPAQHRFSRGGGCFLQVRIIF